ncbi:hypothetical protein [Streptomyces sp. NPDC058457]|uniref:hypothetical protein n=1 Tax=Streptomyces sp. NPDC058457 TaxID=3346507 RepID=UPI00365A81CB
MLPGLAPEHAQGVFAEPATYDAVVRFSNGLPHIRPDRFLGAACGFAIKMFDIPGRSVQDEEADGQARVAPIPTCAGLRALGLGFALGHPGEAGTPPPMPRPDALGRNGTDAGVRKVRTDVAAFLRLLHDNAPDEAGRELPAATMVGRRHSGAPSAAASTR